MSAPESSAYGTIIVVGGGCYGAYYLTQLRRARAAGALTYTRVLLVDRDPACRVASMVTGDADQLAVEDWTAFFDAYLSGVPADTTDAIVPSPMMPHLMYEWLLRRAQARWPGREVGTVPVPHAPPVPWHTAAPDGTSYVSYATWMCPINCIEPRRCPHTRSERTWTMPAAATELVNGSLGADRPLSGPVIFHCTHRAYGVGMFETRDVLAGDAFVADAGARGPADVLVGTVSHCHGALNVLHVGA
jgi:hypothetical protein